MQAFEAKHHREVRCHEVEWFLQGGSLGLVFAVCVRLIRFHLPSLSTIQTACLHTMTRLVAVDAMIGGCLFVIGSRETNDEFIAPLPQALISWPAAVATGFLVNDDVLHRLGFQCDGSGRLGLIDGAVELRIRCEAGHAAEEH